jgi:signal transduction histidine kinase
MAIAGARVTGSRALFLQAFVALAVLFAVTDVASMLRASWIRGQQRALVGNMMASASLVGRMGRAFDREQRVLDTYVRDRDPQVRRRLETQLAGARAEYAAAAATYQPLATETGEAALWRQLDEHARSVEAPLDRALALARAGRDPEARAAREELDVRFGEIDGQVDALVALNRDAAHRTLERVERLQRSSMFLTGALALVGIVLSAVVGFYVLRLLSQREQEADRYAALLEARNRDLDAFAGRVAHDLRAPLTTIGLATSKLARCAPAECESGRMLERGVERMSALIDDLLALSRLGTDAPTEVSDPAVCAEQVREELAARVAGQDVTDNAVKYRRANVPAAVELRGAPDERGYQLCVRDNGIGMSPEETRRAFDPFFRAQRSRERPGTGLGLSIVKRVVEASGGSVCLESQLGQGTTVRIRLPLA